MRDCKGFKGAVAGFMLGCMLLGAAAMAAERRATPAMAEQSGKGTAKGKVMPGEDRGFVPQPEPPGDRITAQTQAWLHGVPGDSTPGGIPVQISSHPGDRRAAIMIRGNEAAIKNLKLLHERRAKADLKLVVRLNPGDKQDTVYNLGGAAVESVQGDQGSSIGMSFDRMSKVAAIAANPGIPAGAPAILPSGINKGWLHLADTKDPNGVPVDVVAYTEPEATGQMKLTFKGSDSLQAILKEFHRVSKDVDMLILMLPDSKTGKYVEYKLAKASVSSLSDGQATGMHAAVFSSDMIECLTGADQD